MSKPLTLGVLKAQQEAAKPPKPPKPPSPAPKVKTPRAKKVVPQKPPVLPDPVTEAPPADVSPADFAAYEAPLFDIAYATANPEAELAARELARRRLLPFIQRFRPSYDAGWVHADICRRLEKFVEDIEAKKSPRLLLMMPVRHGKSEICSRHLPPWILGKHPEWEIIAASGAQNLAMSFSRYARDVIRDPGYAAVFPNTKLDSSSQSVENWNILKGGGYLSAGIGTMITGRGATCLIIDDPVKDGQAADSPTVRENTWEWYMSTAYTRLAPGGGVLGILTWWNEDDWAGRIQQVMATGDGDMFEIVKYPAINEFGDEYLLPNDSIEQFPYPGMPPAGSRLLRPHNTALHPQRYPYDELLKKKANYCALGQKRWWDALFQQNPTPDDGDYFTPDMFRYYSSAPDRREMHIYQAWDFAISTDQKNDYTVGTTVGVDHRGSVYVLDVRRFKSSDSIIISDTILDYAREHDPVLIGFEDGQIWRTLEAQFKRSCDEARIWPSFEVLKPLTDKLVRASPLRGQMQAQRVYFDKNAHWFGELYKEFLRFGAGGVHDDMVDSLSWAIRLTLSRLAPRQKTYEPKIKSWKDDLSRYLQGADASHMAA